PARQRLHHRKTINQLASVIENRDQDARALDPFLALALHLASAQDNARDLTRDLTYARNLAHDFTELDSALANDSSRHFAVTLARRLNAASNRASDLSHAFYLATIVDLDATHARDRALILAHELNRSHDHTIIEVLNLQLGIVRELDEALAYDLDLALAVALAQDRDHPRDLVTARDLVLDLSPIDDPSTTAAQLRQAVSDFRGADLRQAQLKKADLAWITWDENTRWPENWIERIKNASVEQPEGSGQYVILPAFDNDPASIPTDA
ncbi:hypothetical protein IPZ69_41325, partial [Streptomyces olivochromogenes]|nr:hypothetical protein [Streptomyces olivochromogenes]